MTAKVHDWAAVKTAYEGGEPWLVMQAMGPSKSTISRRAKAEGWKRGVRPEPVRSAPRGTAEQVEHGTGEQGTEQAPSQEPRARGRLISSLTIDERLERNSQAASKAVETGMGLLDRARQILADPRSDADMLKAAAQMYRSATEGMAKSNTMTRLNAGLPTTYEKADTKTEGTLKHEFTAETILETARRHLGSHLDDVAGDAVPVAEEVRN